MIITLNNREPLALPSGVTLQPGVPTLVPGWSADARSRVVQAWVEKGILVAGEPEPDAAEDQKPTDDQQGADERLAQADGSGDVVDQAEPTDAPEPEPEYVETQALGQAGPEEVPANQAAVDEKAALIAALEAKGVQVDGRTGVKKLKAMLAESEEGA